MNGVHEKTGVRYMANSFAMADNIEEAKGPVADTDHQEVVIEEKALYAQARLATEAEHNLNVWQALRMYKKAALWSICMRFLPFLFSHQVQQLTIE